MKIEVYDDDKTHEAIAAVVAGKAEFRAAALKVYGEVKAEVATHSDTGRLAASIKLEHGKVDYSISGGTDYDAHAEFGHRVYYDAQGRRTDRHSAVRSVPVKGIGAFRRVVAANGGF